MGKQCFEQWIYKQFHKEVVHNHGDIRIFIAEEYRNDCKEKEHTQSFSGVVDQKHNYQSGRPIHIIMYMARTLVVHSSLHWPERGVDDMPLWSFDAKNYVWNYNRFPNRDSGISPMDHLTQ